MKGLTVGPISLPLIYEWRISGIDMLILAQSQMQNESEKIFKSMDSISIAEDKAAVCTGSYVLHCLKLDSPPTTQLI
jgi:hypothetical protein